MLLRRFVPLAAALSAVACTPGIPQEANPTVDTAVFDPTASKIPLPNDLVFQALAAGQVPAGAQRDLLQVFHASALTPGGACANGQPTCGAFPSDQEVPLTFDFQRRAVDASGTFSSSPAPLDLTKIVTCNGANGATCNLAVIEIAGAAPTLAQIDAPVATDYVAAGDHGTLTLHRKLPAAPNAEGVISRRWTAGAQYVVAVRGGPAGLQTTGGGSVGPSPTFFLLTRGVPLDQPANETLLPGTQDQRLAAGKQLEALRQSYLGAFGLVDKVAFPHDQLAVMSTFQIAGAPASAHVETDSSAGAIPLPSDFLLDPATGLVQNLPGAFGPLAPGLATLDGFSTTAMILAQLSGPVKAASISGTSVFLYKFVTDATGKVTAISRQHDVGEALSVDMNPAKARYISEPPQITQSGAALVIGLQPAEPVSGTPFPPFAVPPLDEDTEYGVVITDKVVDAVTGTGLSRSTLGKILLFPDPLADAAGHSQLAGVPDAQAAGLEKMRLALIPLLGQLQADTGLDSSRVAMAYTFRTQSVTGISNIGKSGPGVDPGVLGLAAAPYKPAALGLPPTYFTPGGTLNKLTPAAAFNKYGIEQVGPPVVPSSNIQEVIEATIPTVNLLSPATGAFGGTPAPDAVTALISVPKTISGLSPCPGAFGLPPTIKCAPLVVFHHGLGGTKAQVLAVADSLNAKGLIVVAIDSPKHGDRAFCAKDSDCEAIGAPGTAGPAGSCVPNPAFAGQGDKVAPGTCTGPGTSGLRHVPQLCTTAATPTSCQQAWATYALTPVSSGGNGGKSSGQTLASANYLVTANFFRTRDTIRQDVFDNSALIVALSPPAAGTPNSVQSALLADGVFVDPTNIQWLGQSYGSILGAINVAANPRIGKAVLNVGGGTTVDIFSTPGSSFYPTLISLLHSLTPPIDPVTTPGTYLQFLNIAKWVLDPADPINFATHVTANTLPNLLNTATPGAPQTAKAVLGQLAHCDTTVPNQTNTNLYLDMGLGPLYISGTPVTGTLTTFLDNANAGGGTCVGVGGSDVQATPHGFITSWGISYAPTGLSSSDGTVAQLTQAAQAGAADFLSSGTASSGNPQPNAVTK